MAQPFLDIAFPTAVARGSTGGPGFSTSIVSLASGTEQRNALWANSRGKWDISTGIRTRAQMAEVIALFYVVKGRAYSFRFRDWNDYDAAGQVMTQVSSAIWQLVKRYDIGGHEHIRAITKPVSGTVAITVNGAAAGGTVDYATGQVQFGSAPATAPVAGFQFDVPVRFDTDDLPVQANAYDQQIASEINLIEVRE